MKKAQQLKIKLNTGLNRNIFFLLLVQGCSYIFPLLTFPYLARVLGPQQFGQLGFCLAAIQYLVLLTDYGFNLTATQKIAKSKKDKQKIYQIFWSVTWAKTFLGGVAFFCLFVLCTFIPRFNYVREIMLGSSLMIVGSILYPIWLFQGMEKMQWISVCSIIARALVVPLTFLVVQEPNDAWIAATLQGGAGVIAGIIAIFLIYHQQWVTKITFSISDVRKVLSEGWYIFLSSSAVSLYTGGVIVILGFLASPLSVAYFHSANTIRSAVQGLLTPVTQGIYPRVNALFDSNYGLAMALIRKAILWLGGISLLFSLTMFCFAEEIVNIGLGDGYSGAISVLRWMAFLPFIITLNNLLGVQTMLAHGLEKAFSRIIVTCGICSILLLFPLAFFWEANGAVISMLITELLITVLMLKVLRIENIRLF